MEKLLAIVFLFYYTYCAPKSLKLEYLSNRTDAQYRYFSNSSGDKYNKSVRFNTLAMGWLECHDLFEMKKLHFSLLLLYGFIQDFFGNSCLIFFIVLFRGFSMSCSQSGSVIVQLSTAPDVLEFLENEIQMTKDVHMLVPGGMHVKAS